MNIDLLPSEQWDHLNEQVKSVLGLSSDASLRTFLGARHAVIEVCMQLAQIYSHKRSIAVVKGATPAFEHVISWFMKEGFHVQQIDGKKLTTETSTQQWIDGLNKDTQFVLWAEDHALTAEYHHLDGIDQKLNEKKIFSLCLSHARHLTEAGRLRPYTALICSFGVGLAVVQLGERLRIQSIIASQVPWDEDKVIKKLKQVRRHSSQFLVEDFENNFKPYKYFDDKTERTFDRAVLCFPHLSGEAIQRCLEKKLNLSRNSDLIETSSLCRWGGIIPAKQWWSGVTPNELRGMMFFSTEVLEMQNLKSLLSGAIGDLEARQEW